MSIKDRSIHDVKFILMHVEEWVTKEEGVHDKENYNLNCI